VSYFLFQKRPDGESKWDDEEGRQYNFSQGLPRATRVSKNDQLLFYRPLKSGTAEDGSLYATARVAFLEVNGRDVIAGLGDFVRFLRPVPMASVGDPRDNAQLSLQPVTREWFEAVLAAAGATEGAG
jgi:hypothetical protein